MEKGVLSDHFPVRVWFGRSSITSTGKKTKIFNGLGEWKRGVLSDQFPVRKLVRGADYAGGGVVTYG